MAQVTEADIERGYVIMRPPLEDIHPKIPGYLSCTCGVVLQSYEQGISHWQKGHFDYVERKRK